MSNGLEALVDPFPWVKYSDVVHQKLKRLRSSGSFTEEDAQARGMRLAVGVAGEREEGNIVKLYLLVDPEDGVVADAKYQAFGQTALLAACEGLCEVVLGRNYDQARRISADLIDQKLRDKGTAHALPGEASPHLNMVLEAVDLATDKVADIPLPESYVAPPVAAGHIEGDGFPGFEELSLQKKLAVIEEVVAAEVRPYIEMDAGGIEVLNLLNDREVIIAYQGACTSCFSATGATLSYIQQVLRAKVHKDLIVIPDM